MNKKLLIFLTFGFFLLPAQDSLGGALFSAGPRWNSFSFQARNSESTPNYFGYGLMLQGGYSILQTLDIALWGAYTPARLKKARLLKEDGFLAGGGCVFALRISSSIYLGVRGGKYVYNLFSHRMDEEVGGRWEGLGAGASIGALLATTDTDFWQISFDWDRAMLSNISASLQQDKETGNRMIDSIAVTLSYVFNGIDKYNFSGNLLGSFLKSLHF